jgi:hypothetical protein
MAWSGEGTPISSTWSDSIQDFIDKVRRMTAMTNTSDGSTSDYIQTQTLTDDEIYDCITNATDDFNSWAPVLTDYTTEDLITRYGALLLRGAQIYMLIMLEFYEAGMFFTVSDDGHSISRDRFPHYQAIKNQLWVAYEKMLTVKKQQIGLSSFGIRGMFSTTSAVPYNAYKSLRATRFSLYGSTRRNTR